MKRRTLEEFYQVATEYIEELYFLQVELLKLQKYIDDRGLRLAILFEGRDTAGKGAAIFRFSQFLNPRKYRVVALGTPTEEERGQWNFQRYLRALPNIRGRTREESRIQAMRYVLSRMDYQDRSEALQPPDPAQLKMGS